MSEEFSYRIIDEKRKRIEIKYQEDSLKLELKKKRAFTVLKAVLKAYPKFLNIHDLDQILNDPNRAHSDLRNEDGYANFLIEKKDERRVINLKLNIPKLFNFFKSHLNSEDFLYIGVNDPRKNLSKKEQDKVYNSFGGQCNITGIKLYYKKELVEKNLFFKHLLLVNFDHRRPLSKGGTNDLSNFQIISILANKEKNKICNICETPLCEECALAYPEDFDIIIPTKQNIKNIKKIFEREKTTLEDYLNPNPD